METFITKIYVKESRGGIRDLIIPLSETQRQHLIITGKNGSGKTSLLEEIKKFLSQIENGMYKYYSSNKQSITTYNNQLKTANSEQQRLQTNEWIKTHQKQLVAFGQAEISFSNLEINVVNQFQEGNFLLACFDAKRFVKLNIPTGINKVALKPKYGLRETVNTSFIQYIVNLKADKSFAKDDNELDAAKQIDEWFNLFENQLKEIFNEPSLKLIFDRKTYNFSISVDGKEPFGFNTLSDGYSAIISIVTELLLRMEAHNTKAYDMEGIVLIDEIETHLHVELQKRVLPFLIAFFPKIQFIVTTHSPFVIQSVANATICDLEHKIVTNDLSSYSYDAILESYFMTDKYSDEVKSKIKEYETLLSKSDKLPEENLKLRVLEDYFSHTPKYLSQELNVKLQEINLKYKG